MSPLPRRMLGSAASWENPQVHPSPLPERKLTYVDTAVTIRLFVGKPHQILNSLFLYFSVKAHPKGVVMFPLPRRMLGRAASWENPQVHPLPLPEKGLTYVAVAVL